ncbi:MAG: type II toxin-antitoxin system HicA family toxin [Thermotogota bacterium]|nr:type II toxin-antitoxin system HicA family toxin [Thermotogota bacterium]
MKSYSSREIIKILEKDGWFQTRCNGDHHIFRHKVKSGKVIVPHPKKDLKQGTLKSILKQAQITLNDYSHPFKENVEVKP